MPVIGSFARFRYMVQAFCKMTEIFRHFLKCLHDLGILKNDYYFQAFIKWLKNSKAFYRMR